MNRKPFEGKPGGNVSVSVIGSATGNIIDKTTTIVRFVNTGSNICHVRMGRGVNLATTSDTPILPNSSVLLRKSDQYDFISFISPLGTDMQYHVGIGGEPNNPPWILETSVWDDLGVWQDGNVWND